MEGSDNETRCSNKYVQLPAGKSADSTVSPSGRILRHFFQNLAATIFGNGSSHQNLRTYIFDDAFVPRVGNGPVYLGGPPLAHEFVRRISHHRRRLLRFSTDRIAFPVNIVYGHHQGSGLLLNHSLRTTSKGRACLLNMPNLSPSL
jgi:hypothetical protein